MRLVQRLLSRFGHRGSIRRRLLLFLIPSLLLLVMSASALTYFVALHVATSAYDRSLLDPALDMAANVRMDPTAPASTLLAAPPRLKARPNTASMDSRFSKS